MGVSKDNLLLGGIYRSPQSDSENNGKLLDIINAATSKHFTHTMIVGDFNIPEIDWNLWTTCKNENHFSYQRYILYRDLKLLLNIDIWPRYDCRSGRQVNRGKKSMFLSAAESVLKVCILAKI